jgi:hypothetical protein
MEKKMSNLTEILGKIENVKDKRARLYFVTRKTKKGMSRSARARDKYEYKTWKIETDSQIQEELFSIIKGKLANIADTNQFTVTDYSLIGDDDSKKILTYVKKERLQSFMHIVDDDLKNASTLDAVTNLEEIANDIWAYIIEVYTAKKIICALRKMAPSKVMVGKKGILATFRTREKSLRLSTDQNISFDKAIDAIYYGDTFYVVSKDNFEEIVGLDEEYREEAKSVAEKIMKNPLICSSFDIGADIENKNRYIKKLAKIKDEIDDLDSERIRRMKDVAKRFGQKFTVGKDGRIQLANEEDLDVMIKLLDDYFLESRQTDKKYGASVKKEM